MFLLLWLINWFPEHDPWHYTEPRYKAIGPAKCHGECN